MSAVSVGTSATLITSEPALCQNNGTVDLFVEGWNQVTTTTGVKVGQGKFFRTTGAVWGIVATGSCDVRVSPRLVSVSA